MLLRQWLSSRSETQVPAQIESSRYTRMPFEYLLGRIIHCWTSWRSTNGLRGKVAKIGRRDGTVCYSRHDVSDGNVIAFEISLNIYYISRSSAECKVRPFVSLRWLRLFAEDGLHLFRFVRLIETQLANVVLVHLGLCTILVLECCRKYSSVRYDALKR